MDRPVVGVQVCETLGLLKLDGVDLATLPAGAYRPLMGVVPQEIQLFAGTIAENIARMGKVDAKEVVKAATQAGSSKEDSPDSALS